MLAVAFTWCKSKVSTLSNVLRIWFVTDKSPNQHSPDPEVFLQTTQLRSEEVTNKKKLASPAFDVIFVTGEYRDRTEESTPPNSNYTTKELLECLSPKLEETEQTNSSEIRRVTRDNKETDQK